MGPEKGWLVKTMRDIKVPWNAVFMILNDLFETKVELFLLIIIALSLVQQQGSHILD